MKWKPKSKYAKTGLTAFCVVAASMILYLILFRNASLVSGFRKLTGIFNPILYGFLIAYLMNPVMQFIENLILGLCASLSLRPGRRTRTALRMLSTFLAAALMLVVIYALISRIIPELIESIRNIVSSFPVYVNNINQWITDTFHNESMDEKTSEFINTYAVRIENWFNSSFTPKLDTVLNNLTSSLYNVLIFLKNLFLGFVVSMYVLITKDKLKARFKRLIYAVFSITTANQVLKNLRFVDRKFGGFLIGKIIDSLIIGVIAYICLAIMKMPYTLLIAIVIGVTNVIPFFGPLIGAIPSAVLIFVVNPIQAIYFLIFIIVLQQFDGNILGPKILGNSVGVSSFMVLVAIIVGAGFFGPVGMVIGVPLFAILIAIGQTYILRNTINKDLPGDLNTYLNLYYMDPETRQPVNDRSKGRRQSLYETIKFRNDKVRALDHPIKDYPWDKTEKEVRSNLEEIALSRENEARSTNPDKPKI